MVWLAVVRSGPSTTQAPNLTHKPADHQSIEIPFTQIGPTQSPQSAQPTQTKCPTAPVSSLLSYQLPNQPASEGPSGGGAAKHRLRARAPSATYYYCYVTD